MEIWVTTIVKQKGKSSRRYECNLWGKAKDPFEKRRSRPGVQGVSSPRKPSDYGRQLRMKCMFQDYYNVRNDSQLRRIYNEASRMKGDTSENLTQLLERRLSAVVYRLNFAPTIFSARQLVSHSHVRVNGKVVNIPSYQIKDGDVIELGETAHQMPIVIEALEKMERRVPEYLDLDLGNKKGVFSRSPSFTEIPYAVQMEPQLVVEFYNR